MVRLSLQNRWFVLFSCAALVAAACDSRPTGPGRTLEQELQVAVEEVVRSYGVAGISAGVYAPDGRLWLGASGYSHEDVAATPRMIFNIASVTKPLVATCVLLLAEEGRLSLSDSIHQWLPAFEYVDPHITVRQLLGHTSGLFEYSTHPGWTDAVTGDFSRAWEPEEVLDSLLLPPPGVPGGGYGYSNTNYLLLGMIIEEATGTTAAEAIRSRILSPHGLSRTFLAVEEAPVGTIAHEWFDLDGDGILEDVSSVDHTSLYSIGWTAGAIYSTPEDLIAFSRALFGGELLAQSSLDQMTELTPVGTDLGYGLGIGIPEGMGDLLAVVPLGHDGGGYGWSARWVYLPESNVHIAITVNQDERGFDAKLALSRRIVEILEDHFDRDL